AKPKTLRLRFLVSPVAILGEDKVEAVEIVKNRLVVDEKGRIVSVATEEREAIPCSVVFRSVGYRGVPLEGVPFDERRGTMPNERGCVEGAERTYCAGWIKRGPSGVIGTNKKDATETVERLLEDAAAGALRCPSNGTLESLLEARGSMPVVYAGWESIDAFERERGAPHGRPRVKLVTWEDLLERAAALESRSAAAAAE